MADLSVDITKLPDEIRDKLAELDLELSEGDITQKGYEKKRARLLTPYIAQQQPQAGIQAVRGPRGDGGGSRQLTRNRRTHRRVTHNEKRYHSEVRQEAVQQALAEMQNRPKPSLPMPSKRTSMMAKSPDRERHDLSSSSDEDSCAGDSELPPPPEMGSPPARLQAGVVPVPIEVPLTRRDAGLQQVGFLLGSCGIQYALTSDACLKGLPKTSSGDVVSFRGWPSLHWVSTEKLPRPPRDWIPPPRPADDSPAHIEHTSAADGSAMGVIVTRASMLSHSRMLSVACNYTEGEHMVCVLDFKRETGLWHAVLASVLNGMHVIFIPYALMKVSPASWMHMITKYRASVAIVKSRDLHWGLLATRDHKEISLSSLRMLLVADGANPWSLSSCDQFLSVFQSKGVRGDAICPCACSSESLTVCVRRAGRGGSSAGRGVLSMSGLSYGVVRVDAENSLTSLTLQDCGQVMPSCVIVVVKIEGPTYLCKTDEVGEICVLCGATGSGYWGLPGLTNTVFRVRPLDADGEPIGEEHYVRSGLLGFLGPGGLVFVCGSRDGLMTVTGRKHNMDDIIATVLAVEPMKFIYRGRIAVFSVRVLRDERICIIAEQRPDCGEEESFQWMSRVLQAVDSIHQVGIYCLALVQPNYLPKTPLGGIHLSECKRRFLEGTLHPANVLMCPHTCVTNLPKPREIHSDVGPASVIVGNLVQGNRLASAQGRDMGYTDDSDAARKYQFISQILRWRAQSTSDHVIFTLLNSKGAVSKVLTCAELHKKAERIGNLLLEKGRVNTGDHVALIFPPGLDLISAFYGCLYVGAVPDTHDTHDAVFVVGALDETIMLRGMRYHPIDIENSVMRCHKKIAECAVFTWTNLLVVVVELDGNDSEALNLVPLVTNTVLEEHHLIVGVVVVVDPGVVPINSRGEKQRMHLRDGFLSDQIDAIYIAYNM
ncbi:PREDICTED: disco-interacting protein 2 [Papilio polytes]|uniref:disco-interacting protein 2 n=1 Tax=Papilio polytes TaxID=76194 RepID=UPI000675E85D|nr:PREDICTED: disco-interacting protein 2 [Papilio polytes]